MLCIVVIFGLILDKLILLANRLVWLLIFLKGPITSAHTDQVEFARLFQGTDLRKEKFFGVLLSYGLLRCIYVDLFQIPCQILIILVHHDAVTLLALQSVIAFSLVLLHSKGFPALHIIEIYEAGCALLCSQGVLLVCLWKISAWVRPSIIHIASFCLQFPLLFGVVFSYWLLNFHVISD